MNDIVQFLAEYGYQLIFIWVALDQAGLPLPGVPLMLAAGAELSLPLIILCAIIASIPVDLFWYWLGRARGGKVLNLF